VILAKTLARGQAPDQRELGDLDFYSALFPLDDLFERTLRVALRVGLQPSQFSLVPRTFRQLLLRSSEPGRGGLALKPDFAFVDRHNPNKRILVGDAKWKRLNESSGTYGLRPGDVYQVITYMAAHGVSSGVLLYPKVEWMPPGPQPWTATFNLIGENAMLTVMAVDIQGLVSREATVRAATVHGLAEGIIKLIARDSELALDATSAQSPIAMPA
jgi:5-methylcytosine-specific restriction endonuclease McrBC regulatory subunit McrC